MRETEPTKKSSNSTSEASFATTSLDYLSGEIDFLIISNDEIRFKLIERLGPETTIVKHTQAVFQQLFEKAVMMECPIALDANAHTKRLDEIELVLKEVYEKEYRFITVLLKASPQTLIQRVNEREPTPRYYQGTESDLKSSLDIIKIDEARYDLVLDTEILSIESEIALIKQLLEPAGANDHHSFV